MELVLIAVRDLEPGSMSGVGPWRPLLVHVAGGDEQEVVQALTDGKQQYGPSNCTAVNVYVNDAEITALTSFDPAPSSGTESEGASPESVTAVEETPTAEALPGSLSVSEEPTAVEGG